MTNRQVLANGMRVLTETVPYVNSESIGIWVAAGARDEDDTNAGISHFIEHMVFKGTEKRSARQIADEFDFVGGQVNGFTEKEYTCFYAKVLSEHIVTAFDVLSDMLLNSKLDESEIALEKNVILEEIKRHEDSPDDLVHDVLAQTVWNGHPLANSILGSKESVEEMSRDEILKFIQTRYTPDNIIVSGAGNLEHAEVVDLTNKFFGGLSGRKTPVVDSEPGFFAESRLEKKPTEQVNFCIGAPGYSHKDEERYALSIIDAILGGSMSSRLFQEIREKRGLVYAIGSYSSSYREGGLFAVYGGTSLDHLDEVADLTKAEFVNVLNNNVTEEELLRAKNQIKGALLLSQESMSSRMIRMAKSEYYLGKVMTLEELVAHVQGVTHASIERAANRAFGGGCFPIVALGPFEN